MSERRMPPAVKLAVEIGPLAVFFGGNAYAGIFFATAAFMLAMALALALSYGFERRIPTLPLVTAVVVGIFGGLTLWLQDEVFIKLKPTIVNALFGVVVLGGALALDEPGWRKLAWRWGFFFLAMAALNEVVWRNVSTDTWVSFKVFGLLPLTFAFALAQVPLMQRHALPEES